MDFDTLIQLLQIGWPAIVTVAFVFLWRSYEARISQQISSLEARTKYLESALIDCLDGKI